MLRSIALTGALLLAPFASAAPLEGTLIGGGGTDDMRLIIQPPGGKKLEAYCDGHCGDWFDTVGDSEFAELKRALKNQKVRAEIAVEPNRGRIAGPGENDRLLFIKNVRLVK